FRNSFDPFIPEVTGIHGTAMAGVIAARDNSIGLRGIAPRAGLFIATAVNREDTQIVEAMYEANAQGAAVICNAWAPETPGLLSPVIRDAVIDLVRNGRDGKGVVFTAAAGNAQIPVVWQSVLAYQPGVITMGRYTNRGVFPQQAFGPWMDALAPGAGNDAAIATTDLPGAPGLDDSSYTTEFIGTSASSAQAAGAAALVLSINPDLTAMQVERMVQEHCRRPAPNNDIIPLGSARRFDNILEFSDSVGYGLLDLDRLTQAAEATLGTPGLSWPAPVRDLEVFESSDLGVMLAWENPPEGPEGEYDRVLVVRFTSDREWVPQDGVEYSVGEQVDNGVQIVFVGDAEEAFSLDTPGSLRARFAVYTINAAGRFSFARTVLKPARGNALVFFDDFEEGAFGWEPSGDWQLGEPDQENARGSQTLQMPRPLPEALVGFNAPFSGANVFATNILGFYEGNRLSSLVSPIIDLTNPDYTAATATFQELLEVEGYTVEFGVLEVIEATLIADPEVFATLLFNHDTTTYTWRTQSFDLTPFVGQRVRLRWRIETQQIDSPEFPGFLGWYIDDLLV
ncbi:MAG: S8 family serine peptidase, partial [Phycisphaerales bacterium]